MNKEFVTYEQALALKELGFDEPCLGYYSALNEGRLCRYEQLEFEYCKNTLQPLVTAPLYQQAFRWFREKYGLDSNTINTNMWTTFSFVINDVPNKNPITTYLDFNTHEEAEQDCLDKLIEICKNK
jgi:hypothetical protein